jgi:IMP dehydrogenase/GMP reductase
MSKLEKICYSLKDVSIIPACITEVNSRKEVNPFTKICGRECYPIFVAPMAAVTDEFNYTKWIDNKLTPVVPRSVQQRMNLEERLNLAEETFVSLSLSEAEEFADYDDTGFDKKYICIDLANGHMKKLLDVCKRIKDSYGDRVEIMTGNIANPQIYSKLCEACISWVRVSIGSGSRCTSSCALGLHFPNASLLDELMEEKKKYIKFDKDCRCEYTKIILDGGVEWYDDINKALALGADAVMIGKLFAECEEACGDVLYCKSEEDFSLDLGYLPDELYDLSDGVKGSLTPYRMYSGMSHRSMQKITGGDGSKVSEGICRPVEVKYPVAHWIENMDSYLRSAMSYTNSKTLTDFKNSEFVILGGVGANVYKK